MANERLRAAMAAAHVDVGELARAAQVDPKTVQRWLAGRTPHARHRWAVATRLSEDDSHLWPDAHRRTDSDHTAEVIAAYPNRADVPPDVWWDLLTKAHCQIDLLGYAMLFLPEQHPRLVPLLVERGSGSCVIRIAVAEPTSPQVAERDAEERLGGTLSGRIRTTLRYLTELQKSGVGEIRCHATPMYNSVFRFDDEMFVTPHLYGVHGFHAPLLHLRRLFPGGVFDRFAAHFDAIWETATPVEVDLDAVLR